MPQIREFLKNEVFTKDWFIILSFLILYLLLFGLIGFIILIIISGLVAIGISLLVMVSLLLIYMTYSFIQIIRTISLKKRVQDLVEKEQVFELIQLVEKGFSIWAPIGGLGDLGKKAVKATPILIDILKNKDEIVRLNTSWALSEIKAKDAIPHIQEIIRNDEDHNIRINAIYHLSKFRKQFKEFLPDIYNIIKFDEDWKKRAYTTHALADLDIKSAIPIIKAELRKDKTSKEKYAFAISLVKLEGIYSEGIDILDELTNTGKIRRKLKKKYHKFLLELIYIERKKKYKRKIIKESETPLTVEALREELHKFKDDILFESKEKEERKLQRRDFWKKLLIVLIPALITGMIALIIKLLDVYLV